ncbi:MAG TPA: DUF3108 domain-containing protein [Ignavibacteria bacterium]|nr:DUF3108 domain-containing protein [Ignavibacteria bacterium]
MHKTAKIFLILFAFVFSNIQAQSRVLQKGEDLIYVVRYGFIKLGEVTFHLTDSFTEDSSKIYTANATMKSYEGIPFVGINYTFETMMKQIKGQVVSIEFHSSDFKEQHGEKYKVNTDCYFLYDSNFIKVNKYRTNSSGVYQYDMTDKKFPITQGEYYQDGLSMFYNARLASLKKSSESRRNTLVFVNEKESSLKYSFNFARDAVSGDLVDYDMAAIKIAGVADFVGVLGLTGEFEAWLSDDEARVPLKAKFNIMIGSVTLELSSYTRSGWTPPRYSI